MASVQEKAKVPRAGKAMKVVLLIVALVILALIAARVIGYGNLGYAAGTVYRMFGGGH